MGLNIGITNDYLLNSSNVPNYLQKYVLWAKARQGGSPGLKPTLDLDFATNKSLVDNVSGQSLVTFTRASSGTYVGSDGLIKSAAVNEARFDHNPTTGESLGLLVEEQRTNLLLRSEEFDNASWTKGASSITANSTTSPFGVATADLLTEDSTNAYHQFFVSQTLSSGSTYTLSLFAKANTRSFLIVNLQDSAERNTWFDLSNGTVGTNASGSTATIQSFGNGWYRCSISRQVDQVSCFAAFAIASANNVKTYAGNGSGSIVIWGAQLEAGAFPTSYIPTTTAAVTRSADVASITGTNFSSFYRSDQGTVFAGFVSLNINSTAGVVSFDNGDSSYLALYRQSTTWRYRSSLASLNLSSINTSGSNKTAFAYASSSYPISVNGTSIQSNAGSGSITGINRMLIGYHNILGQEGYKNSTISRITYWPTRLPDATLQTITT